MRVNTDGNSGLSGGGHLVFSAANARLAGHGSFTISDGTLSGVGAIDDTGLFLTNAGTIAAHVSGSEFQIASFSRFRNSGALLARGGGVLHLSHSSPAIENSSTGRIIAEDGSTVRWTSGVVEGGTFSTVGSGVVRVDGTADGFFNTNLGNFEVPGALILRGGMVNVGSISLMGNGTGASLSGRDGTVSLTGGGTIYLGGVSGQLSGRIGSSADSFMPLVNVDNYIRGRGAIGANTQRIINSGTISADVTGQPITIDPFNAVASFVNNNLIEASNGGRVVMSGFGLGTITNSSGTILAGAASEVQWDSESGVSGGTLSSVGNGLHALRGNGVRRFVGITNSGTTRVENGARLAIQGTISNPGTLVLDGRLGSVQLSTIAAGTASVGLGGGGTILMLSSPTLGTGATIGRPLVPGSVGTLSNSDNTIRGSGTLGAGDTPFVNHGTIVASGGVMVLHPRNAGNNFINTGTLQADSGGELRLVGAGTLARIGDSNGTIRIANGGTFTSVGSIGFTQGRVLNDGVIDLGNGGSSDALHVRGAGTVSIANGATLSIRASGTTEAVSRFAMLALSGGASPSATLDLNDNALILTAADSSIVRSQIASGRNGGAWDRMGITSSSARNLLVANKTLGAISGKQFLSVGQTDVAGFAIAPSDTLVKYSFYGDTDLNGVVNFDDYARTDRGFNNAGSDWFHGDFDYNGVVNFDDYALIDLAFDTQRGGLSGMSAVPEPGALITLTAAAILWRRPRYRC